MGCGIGLSLMFGGPVLASVLGKQLLICHCLSLAGGPVIVVALGFREAWNSSGS